jgi:hypothetical protein
MEIGLRVNSQRGLKILKQNVLNLAQDVHEKDDEKKLQHKSSGFPPIH